MAKLFKRVSRAQFETDRLKASDPQQVYAGLLRIRDIRAYKEGWPRFQFKRIFGEFPNFKAVLPADPSADLLNWLKRQGRNYGQAMGRIRDKATQGNAKALLRIEAIVGEIERLDHELGAAYREPYDGEALKIVKRIEKRVEANQRK